MITADELFGLIQAELRQHWQTLAPNLITKTGTTVTVFGAYTIQPTPAADFVVTSRHAEPKRFYYKSNALNWCVLHRSGCLQQANMLHDLDARAMRAEMEHSLHAKQLQNASGDRYNLLQVKLQMDRDRLRMIRFSIKEISTRAKKIQRSLLESNQETRNKKKR